MNKKTIEITAGQLLLSEPFMLDPNFKRSAVLLCSHNNEDGSLGYVINKPLEIRLNDILASFPEFDADVYFGGPVGTDTMHYIHTLGEQLRGSIKVCEGLWYSGDFEQLKKFASLGIIQPSQIRFFIGYSGWGVGQLQDELRLKSWVMTDMEPEYLFDEDAETLWTQALRDMGSTYSILAEVPEDKSWS